LAQTFADRRQFGILENARGSKKRHFAAISRRKNNILQNLECLAGAAGFEPPNGGIKNRLAALILLAIFPD